jgi:hypothetical protein
MLVAFSPGPVLQRAETIKPGWGLQISTAPGSAKQPQQAPIAKRESRLALSASAFGGGQILAMTTAPALIEELIPPAEKAAGGEAVHQDHAQQRWGGGL